jgi:O-antigen/teichoic acid export membrane protein
MKHYFNAILNRSESIFQTDMRYVLHNGSWQTLGQISIAGMTFILSIAFANLMSQQDYGIYKFILSIAAVIGATRLTGLNQAVIQATAQGFDRTVVAAQKMNLKWSILPITIYSAVAGYYYIQSNITLAAGILIAGYGVTLIGIVGLYGSYLAGKTRYKLLNIDTTIVSITSVVVLFCTLLVTSNIIIIITAGTLATALPYAILSRYRLNQITTTDTVNYKALTFAKHLSLQNIIAVGASHIDKILLFQRLGGVELAIYAFSIAIPEQMRGVLRNTLGIIIPKYSELARDSLRKSIYRKTMQLTLLICIPITMYILTASSIFSLLFPQYTEAVLYSQLFMGSMITLPFTVLAVTYFNVQEQSRALYYSSLINNISRLFLTVILIILLGIFGAILAQIFSRIIEACTLGFFYWRDRTRAFSI